MSRPDTVDNRWDILYARYPEVYHEFSGFPYNPKPVDVIAEKFDLAGKTIVEVGSGTGRSAFRLAELAHTVVGVEVEPAMLEVAEKDAQTKQLKSVTFKQGSAEQLPLEDESVDMVLAFTAPLDTAEGLRVVRGGGLLARLDIAPGAYGGDIGQHVGLDAPELATGSQDLIDQGYSFFDFESEQDYGDSENMISTYGFIFGPQAIDYIRENQADKVKWTFRVHYLYKQDSSK